MLRHLTLAGAMLGVFCVVASPAAKPPPEASLGNGMMAFTPPPEPWKLASAPANNLTAFYQSPTGSSVMLVAMVGGGAPRDETRAKIMRKSVVDQLKANFRRKGHEMLIEPREEAVDRFWLVVREKYRKDAGTVEQWHYYRTLQPHLCAVTLITYTENEQELKQARDLAEAVALSARLVDKTAEPAPPPPDPDRAVGEWINPDTPAALAAKADIAAAQKRLDAASTQCLEDLYRSTEYKQALVAAEAAETRVRELRAARPVDREALVEASAAWIRAKAPLEKLKTKALETNPGVADAKRALEQAREKLNAASRGGRND